MFLSPFVGQAFLILSPLQISSLAVISGRLWVGTGGGAIFSIPLSITSEDVSIPYCSIASAQLCYHGHRQAVRFIVAAPGCLITSPGSSTVTTSQLILSGGEGYINFRIGDDASDGSVELSQVTPQRSERSHMIIWQNPTPSVPSPALWHCPPPCPALSAWDTDGADIYTIYHLDTTLVLSRNLMSQRLNVEAIKMIL